MVTAFRVTIRRHSALIHFASAAFDFVAVIYAYVAFRRSGSYRALCLRQRMLTELMRQWFKAEYILAPVRPALMRHVEALLERWEGLIDWEAKALGESAAILT